jgi:predicted hydrocarbon binding protein
MAEAHSLILEFFIAQLGPGCSLEKYRDRGEWVPAKIIKEFSRALLRKGSRILLKQAGQTFAAQVYADVEQYKYGTFEDAISLLPKVFTHYFRGEGSGIIKFEYVGPGFMRVQESTPFDCFFTEGLFTGLLQNLGAHGVIVRHTICRADDEKEKFCVYELKWMRTHKGPSEGRSP